jgi:ABC-type Fe3+ transport system substrate-binding protein
VGLDLKEGPASICRGSLVDFLLSKEGQQLYLDGNRLVARRDMAWNFGGKQPKRINVLSDKWTTNYGELAKQFDQIFR